MRKIKFKVWLKKEKEMYSPLDFTPPTKNNFSSKVWVNVDNNTILLQFTGLYDKNGKEIYEGDILHEFKEKTAPIANNGINRKFVVDDIRELEFSPLNCEVIGNTFENPELLN